MFHKRHVFRIQFCLCPEFRGHPPAAPDQPNPQPEMKRTEGESRVPTVFSLWVFFVYYGAGIEALLFFQPVPDIIQPLALVLEVARAGDGVFSSVSMAK